MHCSCPVSVCVCAAAASWPPLRGTIQGRRWMASPVLCIVNDREEENSPSVRMANTASLWQRPHTYANSPLVWINGKIWIKTRHYCTMSHCQRIGCPNCINADPALKATRPLLASLSLISTLPWSCIGLGYNSFYRQLVLVQHQYHYTASLKCYQRNACIKQICHNKPVKFWSSKMAAIAIIQFQHKIFTPIPPILWFQTLRH